MVEIIGFKKQGSISPMLLYLCSIRRQWVAEYAIIKSSCSSRSLLGVSSHCSAIPEGPMQGPTTAQFARDAVLLSNIQPSEMIPSHALLDPRYNHLPLIEGKYSQSFMYY